MFHPFVREFVGRTIEIFGWFRVLLAARGLSDCLAPSFSTECLNHPSNLPTFRSSQTHRVVGSPVENFPFTSTTNPHLHLWF